MTRTSGKAHLILLIGTILLLVLVTGGRLGAQEGKESLTLREAVSLALKEHPTIRQSMENVNAARYGIGVARGALFPQVNFSADYFYGNAFARVTRGAAAAATGLPSGVSATLTPTQEGQNFYIYQFQMNQLLYDFGKTPGLVAESRATFGQTQQDYAGNRQQVVLDARTAYFAYLATQRALKVQEDTVKQNQDLVKQAQGFYQVGLRAKIDVTKAEANLYNAEANLIKAKNAVELSRVTLMNALGLKAWPYKTVEDVLEVTPIPRSVEELKAQALERRPEIVKNRFLQQYNQSALQVAQAGHYPVFTSTASYGWQGQDYPVPGNWWMGASVNFPLFEGLTVAYAVAQSKANLRASQANAEVLRQNVTKDVDQAYLDVKAAWEFIRASKKALEAARENWRLAQGRYQVGVGSIIEVTDAQVQYSQADLTYVQALYDYRTAEARLDKAIGRAF
jgi:outer membrane protein